MAVLYDQYASVLYGIVLQIVPSETEAQDILQEAFLKVWQAGPTYDPARGSLFTWMLNITRNTAIDKTRSKSFKKKAHWVALEDNTANLVDWSVHPQPDHIGLKKEVDSLEFKYRQVIELLYFRGFTQREVVELLRIPLGTVKSRTRIALRKLRKIFEESSHFPDCLLLLPVFYHLVGSCLG